LEHKTNEVKPITKKPTNQKSNEAKSAVKHIDLKKTEPVKKV